MGILIKNATIVTGDQTLENHSLLIENGVISKVAEYIEGSGEEEIDMKGDYVTPGFVDLQINGGAGAFFYKRLEC